MVVFFFQIPAADSVAAPVDHSQKQPVPIGALKWKTEGEVRIDHSLGFEDLSVVRAEALDGGSSGFVRSDMQIQGVHNENVPSCNMLYTIILLSGAKNINIMLQKSEDRGRFSVLLKLARSLAMSGGTKYKIDLQRGREL